MGGKIVLGINYADTVKIVHILATCGKMNIVDV